MILLRKWLVVAVTSCAVSLLNAAEVPDGAWNGKAWDRDRLEEGVKSGNSEALAESVYWANDCRGGTKQDRDLMLKRSREAAGKNNPYGEALLAWCLWEGWGTTKDPEEALKFAELSSKAGHPLGTTIKALCLLGDPESPPRGWEKGIELMEAAADEGCVEAKVNRMRHVHFGQYDMDVDGDAGKRRAVDLFEDFGTLRAATLLGSEFRYHPSHPGYPPGLKDLVWARVEEGASGGEIRSLAILGRDYCMNGRGNEGVPLIIAAYKGKDSYAKTIARDMALGTTLSEKGGGMAEYTGLYRISLDCYDEGQRGSTTLWWVAGYYLETWKPGGIEPEKALPLTLELLKLGNSRAHIYMGKIFYSTKKTPLYDKRRGEAHFLYLGRSYGPSFHYLAEPYIDGVEEDRDLPKAHAVLANVIKGASGVNLEKAKRYSKEVEGKMTKDEMRIAEELVAKGYPVANEYQKEAFDILKEYGDLPEDEVYVPVE